MCVLDCYETTTEEEKMQGGRTSREQKEREKEDHDYEKYTTNFSKEDSLLLRRTRTRSPILHNASLPYSSILAKISESLKRKYSYK